MFAFGFGRFRSDLEHRLDTVKAKAQELRHLAGRSKVRNLSQATGWRNAEATSVVRNRASQPRYQEYMSRENHSSGLEPGS
jgi:hypothetical protein